MPLRGFILLFDVNKKYSEGFNEGLITHWGTSLSNGFVLFFKFSLIFMNMQMRSFSYMAIRSKDVSNCITDDIENATMVVW